MRVELEARGHLVHLVAINYADRAESQDELGELCAFPLLQDVENVAAISLLGMHKDDLVILDSDGNVATYLPMGGEVVTNLQSEQGYANVVAALLAVD